VAPPRLSANNVCCWQPGSLARCRSLLLNGCSRNLAVRQKRLRPAQRLLKLSPRADCNVGAGRCFFGATAITLPLKAS
jgi:hypothetical protein